MKNWLMHLIRKELLRHDYVLWKREFLRFGISPFIDIRRLNRTWDREVDVVFDVGANIGQFATVALEELPAARIYSFEPHPQTFKTLQIAMSHNDQLSLHQTALGEKIGNVTLYEYGASGDGSLINSLVPNARFPVKFGYSAAEIAVPCTTVDTFCEENGVQHIGFLKVDAEGFDFFVLQGARRMLRERRVDYVYVEFNDLRPSFGTSGGALMPISDYLAEFGLQYVITYTDFVLSEREISVCANALFALPSPKAAAPHVS